MCHVFADYPNLCKKCTEKYKTPERAFNYGIGMYDDLMIEWKNRYR